MEMDNNIPAAPRQLPPVPTIIKEVNPTPKPTFEPVRLHFAINNGDIEGCRNEIARKLDIDYIIHGYTPLLLAIIKEHYDIAKLLIKAGADVNKREKFKLERQPLHVACKMGVFDVVKCLVEEGRASIHSCDNDGNTPLNVAAYEGHVDIVYYLCNCGAHINVKDGRGKTPLFNAVENIHFDTAMFLLNEGGCINTCDDYGWTPLIHCIVCGNYGMAKMLILKGASLEIADRRGERPLHFACDRLRSTHLRCLCKGNIDFYTRHLEVVTPIIIRAIDSKYTNLDFVEMLVDFGCDINAKSGFEQSPLGLSLDQCSYDVADYLLQAGCNVSSELLTNRPNIPKALQFKLDTLKDQVKPLLEICRVVVRLHLGRGCRSIKNQIAFLPLPSRMKEYLQIQSSSK